MENKTTMYRINLPNIRLSIMSVIRSVESNDPAQPNVVVTVPQVDWKTEIADAGILSGMSFFATLGGTIASGIPFASAVLSAAIAAGGLFFGVLAAKRGLQKPA